MGDPSHRAESKRRAVLAELLTEIGVDHRLHGRIDRVEAFFEGSDDVVVRLLDGTFALVHPTWSGRLEEVPYPTSTLLGPAREAEALTAAWERDR